MVKFSFTNCLERSRRQPMKSNNLLLFLIQLVFLCKGSFTLAWSIKTKRAFDIVGRKTALFLSTKSLATDALTAVPSEQEQAVSWGDWKKVASSVFDKEDQRPVILFDGVCNLCNGGVNFALDNDSTGNFRFAALQSKVGQALLMRSGREPDDTTSIVLVTADEVYFRSEAVLRIARGLDGPMFKATGVAGSIMPEFIRNMVYDYVSENRYQWLGESDSCRLDGMGEFADRFVDEPSSS
mmetsp:Transcript_37036/g.56911  ORF Transcript_37036/g.56911 Transcript_37036/m.56911 type:complete len:239 (-) Transcript_37036:109-825(-)